MTAIIVLILLVIMGICKDDYSLVIAIGKFIGIGALILGVLWIIAYCPWLIILIIIGLIVFLICHSSNNNSSTNNTTYNNYSNNTNQSENTSYSKPIYNSELTGFKAELQENTKTPKQVEDENWLKEKEEIIKFANNDYSFIKKELLNKAKCGQYIISNGQRRITLDFVTSYLLGCIERKYSSNPTGKIGTSSYRKNEKVYYNISKIKQYNLYLSTINELASIDQIDVKVAYLSKKDSVDIGNYVTLPYTYTNNLLVSCYKIVVYLQCSIEY